MALSADLAAATGLYFGTGDGVESGAFVSRIEVSPLPNGANGGVAISYEATSREQGVQHREHSLLAPGPDGRDHLYVAFSESPFVTEFVETTPGTGRFEQAIAGGPYVLVIVIALTDSQLTYAWWWGLPGEEPVERSKATATRI
jgi:hypothetical protein